MSQSGQTASDFTVPEEGSPDPTTATRESYARLRRGAAKAHDGENIVRAYEEHRQGSHTRWDWDNLSSHLNELSADHEDKRLEILMKRDLMHAIFFVCGKYYKITKEVYAEVLESFRTRYTK